jgi:hypothetical protein
LTIGTLDGLNIYESRGTPSLSTLAANTFYPTYPKSSFSYIAFAVPKLRTSYEVSSASYVGWLYITNDADSNPYDSLPSYFTTEAAALNT